MRRRENLNLLSASKGKALMMAIVFGVIWLILAMTTAGMEGGSGNACSAPFFGVMVAYGLRWLYCHNRDKRNIVEAQLAREFEQTQSRAPLAAPKSQQFSPLYIPERPE